MSTNELIGRELPAELHDLAELALDLRWTGSHFTGRIWKSFDEEAWERTRNPYLILLNAHQDRLEAAARDERLLKELEAWLDMRERYTADPGWFGRTHADAGLGAVAYFSMEFGLSEGLPIHSGGLGILAGDHLKAASDLGVPLVGIGLLYQQGYFRQVLGRDGEQLEAFPYNDPGSLPVTPLKGEDGHRLRVRLELPGRTLYLRVWHVRVGKVPLYLLDSNDPLNIPWDRGITANLYAAGREKRLLQEIALGVGGWRLLERLGIDVDVCHLNEGHAAFVVLARAADFAKEHGLSFREALRATRAGTVFTTHTPVDAAFDKFDPELVARWAGPILEGMGVPLEELLRLGRHDPRNPAEPLNMAFLALRGAGRVNGVSRLHGEVSRRLFAGLFPGRPVAEVPVGHVTNGVHVRTWYSWAAGDLWGDLWGDGSWSENLPEAAARIAEVDDPTLWSFRAKARRRLVEYVRRRLARQLQQRGLPADRVERGARVLDPNALTLGFARRFTGYKRPTILLNDRERLARLLTDRRRPVQLIVAGKAHPNDDDGKAMVRELACFAARDDLRDRVVFLEDYDMVLARYLAGGVDVWLNAPRRPNEACGTSGMKMLVNGGLNLSTLDGWWDEAWSPEVGWAFGGGRDCPGGECDTAEATELYERLEKEIVPEFYGRDGGGVPGRWLARVRASMSRLTPRFCAARMVRDYVEGSYLPSAEAWRRRAAGGGALGRALEAWYRSIRAEWEGIRFVEVRSESGGDRHRFEVAVYLGELTPEAVRVELYADPAGPGEPHRAIPLDLAGEIPGTWHGYRYGGEAPADRPSGHYTPRVVPHHPEAILPLEASGTHWYRG